MLKGSAENNRAKSTSNIFYNFLSKQKNICFFPFFFHKFVTTILREQLWCETTKIQIVIFGGTVVKNSKIKTAVPCYFSMLQFSIISLKKRVSIVMPIYKIMLFSFISILSLLSVTCKNEVAAVEDNAVPGRRDYTWKVDTLWTDDWIGITDIWGDTPNSVYVTAGGTSYKDCFWYYNGQSWYLPDQILNSDLNTIFGLNPDEIWIGDSEGQFWKKHGNSWKIFKTFTLPDFDVININRISGISSNNLYAIGFAAKYNETHKGIIFKFDGTDWNLVDIPNMKIKFYDIKPMKNGKFIITGLDDNDTWKEKIYVYDGTNNFKEIYSGIYWPGLNEINGEIYISINNKIYKVKNDMLVEWKDFTNSTYFGGVLGRSEKDFFSAGYEGIMHYNGTDLAIVYPAHLNIAPGLIFEKDVFFIGWDSGKKLNIIIRGTLKE